MNSGPCTVGRMHSIREYAQEYTTRILLSDSGRLATAAEGNYVAVCSVILHGLCSRREYDDQS